MEKKKTKKTIIRQCYTGLCYFILCLLCAIIEKQSWELLCPNEEGFPSGEPGRRHTATAVPYHVGMRFAEHPAPLTHAAHSPKTPQEPLNGIAIYRARLSFFLKEFALVLGAAVDFTLWGFFFKSPEFQGW